MKTVEVTLKVVVTDEEKDGGQIACNIIDAINYSSNCDSFEVVELAMSEEEGVL